MFSGTKIDLNYAEFDGHGPALVISHGFSSRWQGLAAYAEALTDWHVYAVDQAGHGLSSERRATYRFVDFADDMAEFIESVSGPNVAFIGASLGGMVGMIITGTRPELINTLILGDIPIALFRDNYMGSWLQKARAETLEQVKEKFSVEEEKINKAKMFPTMTPGQIESLAIAATQLRPETAGALADGTMLDEIDINQALRDTIAPTLMLQGDDTTGFFLPDSGVEEMKTLLRDFETKKFAGMGHGLDYGAPGDAFATVVDFLNRRHRN
ncbi:MAG TPA: alpha/beta hydrolase [Dehalococcoidia bacterium]|nr:alpha/beta hydrolase [Dehalococcoidia bacterium]HIK88904.1 alpha/beta hydrolase [Dehalococcoidia bacterium]